MNTVSRRLSLNTDMSRREPVSDGRLCADDDVVSDDVGASGYLGDRWQNQNFEEVMDPKNNAYEKYYI